MPRQKPRWWPRNRQPFPKTPAIGKIQTSLSDALRKIPKVLLHPLWGLLVATLITISGRGELLLKSSGITLAAVWLIVDTWFRLIPTPHRYRIIIGWVLTNFLLISVMGVMDWWLSGKLADEREDAEMHLTIQFSSIDPDPNKDTFTVTNNSSQRISGKHTLACLTNDSFGYNGRAHLGRVWFSVPTDPVTGKPHRVFIPSGGPKPFWDAVNASGPPIQAGGDSETFEDCMDVMAFGTNTECLDVTVAFLFSLEAQPLWMQQKYFRFVGKQKGTAFIWQQEPLASPYGRYCNASSTGPSQ